MATGNLHLPRILCLHGGGVNAEIFAAQCRALTAVLTPDFRLVFADGPFFCPAGPGIAAVYESWGPFRRWTRWLPEHAAIDDDAAADELLYAAQTAIGRDGGSGPFVGILGFSQGAKVAASLLYEQQQQLDTVDGDGGSSSTTSFMFGVLMAGRAPLVSLSARTAGPRMQPAGTLADGFDFQGLAHHDRIPLLIIPTVHWHGLGDPDLALHRILLEQYCDPSTATVVEWPGGHRVPVRSEDAKRLGRAIVKVAEQCGALVATASST